MRWAERFVNFIVHQRQTASISDCRERFVFDLAATRSATPWLLQEIQEAIAVVLQVTEPSELAQLVPASSTILELSLRRPVQQATPQPGPSKLVDQIRAVIRAKHYSRRTARFLKD
jgi:hypothetical protein